MSEYDKKKLRVNSKHRQHFRGGDIHIVTVRVTVPKYQGAVAKQLVHFSPPSITWEKEENKQLTYSVI
jgi:hypothetical protein